jgi:multisubunit Na+/H+ antiporter MnhB subunit
MPSLILQTATRVLVPIQLAFSLYLLWRGHNEPGGGFIAGLVVSSALGLLALAFSPGAAKRLLRVPPGQLVGAGMLVALFSGAVGILAGDGFLTGQWVAIGVPFHIKLGTPLLFDAGVYLVVIGAGAAILFSLMSEGDD